MTIEKLSSKGSEIQVFCLYGNSGKPIGTKEIKNGKADYFAINYLTREMIKNLFDHCEKSV